MDDKYVICGCDLAELKPSAELRFVIRYMPDPMFGAGISKAAHILQQKWVATAKMPDGGMWEEHRWRDVPLIQSIPAACE